MDFFPRGNIYESLPHTIHNQFHKVKRFGVKDNIKTVKTKFENYLHSFREGKDSFFLKKQKHLA